MKCLFRPYNLVGIGGNTEGLFYDPPRMGNWGKGRILRQGTKGQSIFLRAYGVKKKKKRRCAKKVLGRIDRVAGSLEEKKESEEKEAEALLGALDREANSSVRSSRGRGQKNGDEEMTLDRPRKHKKGGKVWWRARKAERSRGNTGEERLASTLYYTQKILSPGKIKNKAERLLEAKKGPRGNSLLQGKGEKLGKERESASLSPRISGIEGSPTQKKKKREEGGRAQSRGTRGAVALGENRQQEKRKKVRILSSMKEERTRSRLASPSKQGTKREKEGGIVSRGE